ncbi:hypothetical protein J6590_041508 [Homalodisca vitripennis]|nr:hypothetical protein J6590_041503 [Homalodisca vitripennis]KAG8292398.1 hypothetical protein J6590_041508 [Homalodisca vitripennis]
MDPVVLYAAYRHFVNKKRKRRCSVHPINNARYSDGAYRNLYGLLREHDDKFFNYMRMSISSFDELVVKLWKPLKFGRNCEPGDQRFQGDSEPPPTAGLGGCLQGQDRSAVTIQAVAALENRVECILVLASVTEREGAEPGYGRVAKRTKRKGIEANVD